MRKLIDLPDWLDCNEMIEGTGEAYRNNPYLDPLQSIIYHYDDVDTERSVEFKSKIKTLVEWCINCPNEVIAGHEELNPKP